MLPAMSPVEAPGGRGERSCAPYPILILSPSTSVCTLRRSVKGGRTTTSTSSSSFSVSVKASFCTSAMASRWLRFIFQLPAISGRRGVVAMGSDLQCGEAGEGLALQVLQRGSPAGRDVPERGLVEPEYAHRRGGVPAADHGEPVHRGDRLRHPAGAGGERRHLEDAHRAVPE